MFGYVFYEINYLSEKKERVYRVVSFLFHFDSDACPEFIKGKSGEKFRIHRINYL